MSKAKLIAFRPEPEQDEELRLLAEHHGTSVSEIVRRFVAAGVEANPLTTEQRRAAKAKIAARASGALPGLVVPISPVGVVRDGVISSTPSIADVAQSVEQRFRKPLSLRLLTRHPGSRRLLAANE